MQKIFEKVIAEFDKRINTQLKIMAGLGDDTTRYGCGKSLEAYEQGKLIVENAIEEHNESLDICNGCKNIGEDCMHCSRAYSDCYELNFSEEVE